MIKNRGLKNNTSVYPAKKLQQPSLYLGNKMAGSYSVSGGKSYRKPSGGCGCGGKVTKKTGLQIKK